MIKLDEKHEIMLESSMGCINIEGLRPTYCIWLKSVNGEFEPRILAETQDSIEAIYGISQYAFNFKSKIQRNKVTVTMSVDFKKAGSFDKY